MPANTAADALSKFLNSSPEQTPQSGQLIDRLGHALLSAGEQGLPIPLAMDAAGLSRPEFLSILNAVTGTGLVEMISDPQGQQKLRLTQAGKSLY
jgi:AraC-like DNA-binding protein